MANLTLVKRDGRLVERLYNERATVKAVCQISKIDDKADYVNVAIQKVYFVVNNIEYYFDHVWLQQKDYKLCSGLKDIEEGKWVEIEFTFYKYHDKIQKNKKGRMMHGLTLSSFTLIDKKDESIYNEKFVGIKNDKFTVFNSALKWLY